MQTVIYDGSFNGFLCAVFDVYEYRFTDAEICTEENFKGNVFARPQMANHDPEHFRRVWQGLKKILSPAAQQEVYRAFLSELPGIENTLLRYIRYAFASKKFGMENDVSNSDVLTVRQTAKKAGREKHRMEAFVRFQKTGDELFYAVIEPDCNVLPLIAPHFEERYADQKWMIYDARRRYGIYYDGESVSEIQVAFAEDTGAGRSIAALYDEGEELYQQLWQQYFRSVNISARKNTKLHLQHMPKRYWKYLTEKKPQP